MQILEHDAHGRTQWRRLCTPKINKQNLKATFTPKNYYIFLLKPNAYATFLLPAHYYGVLLKTETFGNASDTD